MEMQQPTRSKWTVPILLVIIVASLMLNVLLYSQSILSKQQDAVDRGKVLVDDAYTTQSYVESLQSIFADFMASTTREQRGALFVESMTVNNQFEWVERFISVAQEGNLASQPDEEDAAYKAAKKQRKQEMQLTSLYFTGLQLSLNELAQHEGTWTNEQMNYMKMMSQKLADLQTNLKTIPYPIKMTRNEALAAEVDARWQNLSKQLLQHIRDMQEQSLALQQ